MSNNEGEILATVFAIQRVLEAYKFTMHDLAESITVKGATPNSAQPPWWGSTPPKANTHNATKTWKYNNANAPTFDEVMKVCELFIVIRSPRIEDGNFMHALYIDLNILKQNYYMSALEVERFNEVRRRYRI
jgi:hypothetical protein